MNNKMSFGAKIGYGIGAAGEGLGYNVFFSFFIFFLTTIAGIPPAIAGVIASVAVLWDAVTDPIIGNMSDNTRNPRGRRRPFIMIGSILMGFAMALLFVNFNMPTSVKIVYFILINAFYWVSLTSCVIPHISLGSELTEDYNERTTLRTCAAFIMSIGTMVATSCTLIFVDFYEEVFNSESAGWAATGITYGFMIAIVYNVCCLVTRGKEPRNLNLTKTAIEKKSTSETLKNFWHNAKKAFKNKPLRLLLVVTFMVNVVVTLGSGLFVYVLTYVYEYSDVKISAIYLFQAICVMVSTIIAGYVASKTEKKTVMIVGIILYMLSYLIIMALPISDTVMYASMVMFGLGNSAYWTMIYAMSYDTSVIEQIKSGEKPDGLYTSLIGLFMKFGNALGSLVVGVGLQLVGFSAELAVQSDATVSGIKIIFGIGPTVVFIFGLIAAIKYPVTQEKFQKLIDVLHRKENTQEYNVSEIDDILRH